MGKTSRFEAIKNVNNLCSLSFEFPSRYNLVRLVLSITQVLQSPFFVHVTVVLV
jgi:hypothetical protein